MIPPWLRVLDPSTFIVPWLVPRAMPRFELSVKSAEECNVPPFNVKCPAVAEPGAAPNPLSALILIVPALIVVDPEYVLVPERVNVQIYFRMYLSRHNTAIR